VLKEWGAYGGDSDLAGFAHGVNRASIAPDQCRRLARLVYDHRTPGADGSLYYLADAVELVAHETEHLVSAGGSEAVTECYGMQDVRRLARALGASASYAAKLAEVYWKVVYPENEPDYRTSDCRNGGPLDARPASDLWP
jgi:hypothetical protein